jgi:hypothetical protein
MSPQQITNIHAPSPGDIAFTIGKRLDGTQKEVVHSMKRASNFHHALIGTSGVGKTFTIRKMAIEFAAQGVTQFILDTQGDYAHQEFLENHDLKGVRVNEIKFGYGVNTCALNPFVIHSADQGGYHHAVIGVLETIRLFNPSMGSRQRTLLRRLVNTAYERNGISKDDPASWHLEPPTMKEFLAVIDDEIKAARLRVESDIFDTVDGLRKKCWTISNKREKENSEERRQVLSQELEAEKDELFKKLSALIENEIQSPDRPSSSTGVISRLESIQDMIEGVVTSGLFDGLPVTPKKGAINVLDLTDLNAIDQQPVFYLLLERTFHSAVRTCRNLNPSVPDLMFCFDEVKLFTALADSPLDPINRFFTEGRKYGLGSLCGLQHAKQLTDEMRSSIGTLLVLPVAKEKMADVKRLWGISEENMTRLKPKSDAMYGFANNDFLPMKLFG